MKLPEKTNPAYVASTDPTRYILNGVYINGDLAVATSGRTLVAAIGERDETDSKTHNPIVPTRIAKQAWPKTMSKKAALYQRLRINDDDRTCSAINRDGDEITAETIKGNYPRVKNVFPDVEGYTQSVGLNARLLMQIAEALGSDELILHFSAERHDQGLFTAPIYVTKTDSTPSVGILMPLRGGNRQPLKDNKAINYVKQMEDQP